MRIGVTRLVTSMEVITQRKEKLAWPTALWPRLTLVDTYTLLLTMLTLQEKQTRDRVPLY